MSIFQCGTCGASLEVTAFATTSICEYCGSTTDLKRDNIKRLEENSSEISPEEYKKQIDRAAQSFDKGFYDKSFEIIEKLKKFSEGDISFKTLYASYFIAAKFYGLIGKKGAIRLSWRDSCDNSGAACYDEYYCPDFDEVFHDFDNALEDCEELIAAGDEETSKAYATQIKQSLTLCRQIWQEAFEELIENYSWTQEEKTKTIKVGDDWITKNYTEYGKNDQVENVAIEMSRDMIKFNAKIYRGNLKFTVNQQKILLTHGDGLLSRDYGYRFMRRIIRSQISIYLFKILGGNIGCKLAKKISNTSNRYNHSEIHNKKKSIKKETIRTEINKYVISKWIDKYDAILIGHYHQIGIDKFNKKKIIYLGDWLSYYTVTRLDHTGWKQFSWINK